LYCKDNILEAIGKQAKKTTLLRLVALLALAEICLFFAGHIQIVLYATCVSTLYLVYRIGGRYAGFKKGKREFLKKCLLLFVGNACIVGIVVYFQYAEFFQFASLSNRSIDQLNWQREGWFIPLKHLVQFVAPDFFGNPATLNYWGTWNYGEMVGYVGIVSLVFSVYAIVALPRKMLFWLTLLLVSLLFATQNILSELPFRLSIPFISTSQPTRLVAISAFSMSVLASFGLDRLISGKRDNKIWWVVGIVGTIIIALWLLVLGNMLEEHIVVVKRNIVLPTLLVVAVSVILVAQQIIGIGKKTRIIFGSIFIVITIFDLVRFGWKFTPFTPDEYLYPETKVIQFLKKDTGVFRIMATDNRILPPNANIVHRLQSIDGYDPLYLSNYSSLASAIVRNTPDISSYSFNRIITIQNPDSRLIDLLNVKYVLSLNTLSMPHLRLVFEEGQTKVYENTRVFPRAFLVNSIIHAQRKEEAMIKLFDPSVNLATTAVSSDDIQISLDPFTAKEIAAVTGYTESEVLLDVATEETRMLVLTDTYHPGWSAYIDGVKTIIYPVDLAFRGVIVPPGRHAVQFTYSL
jgi:hypothetical protein